MIASGRCPTGLPANQGLRGLGADLNIARYDDEGGRRDEQLQGDERDERESVMG